ncbi:hypothetical protein BDV33DRAFT_76006 [Aspergillus novoparasiticus]|uniref:Uncharacterized protein n=1 Tax=Aspergillus novoparasiticus TaxID=986946 RepID=A0A5N6E7B1_9EURO|nr:hypothetical protein BDV33DRAFT_76006 [Aspergillus novoparasiticus]
MSVCSQAHRDCEVKLFNCVTRGYRICATLKGYICWCLAVGAFLFLWFQHPPTSNLMHTYTLKKFPTAFKLDTEVNSSIKLATQYSDRLNHMRLDVDTTSHEEGMRISVRASDPSRRSFPYCRSTYKPNSGAHELSIDR